jgi:hypothetical protein
VTFHCTSNSRHIAFIALESHSSNLRFTPSHTHTQMNRGTRLLGALPHHLRRGWRRPAPGWMPPAPHDRVRLLSALVIVSRRRPADDPPGCRLFGGSAPGGAPPSSPGDGKADDAKGPVGANRMGTQVERSEKVVKLALAGNVIITVAKLMAWMHSGSRLVGMGVVRLQHSISWFEHDSSDTPQGPYCSHCTLSHFRAHCRMPC